MKAQVSIEYLLLLSIILSLFAIILVAYENLYSVASKTKSNLVLSTSAEDINALIEDACAMGPGNRFEYSLYTSMDLDSGCGLSMGEDSVDLKSKNCEIECIESSGKKANIEYSLEDFPSEEEKIKIELGD